MGFTNEGNPADQDRFGGSGVLGGSSEAPAARAADLERALADERRRTEQLSLALHESEENMQRSDALISMATHDLRSPLGSIQLNIQSILHARRPVPRWIRSRLARAEELVRHAAKLISDLLTFERSRLVPSEPSADEMDLDVFVRQTIGLLEEQIRAAKCSVYIHCEGPIRGRWDKVCLGQIVSNLVGNAIKFGAGKPLEITIGRSAAGVRIVVSDHGIGLAEGTTSGSSSASSSCSRPRSRAAWAWGCGSSPRRLTASKARSACAAHPARARRSSSSYRAREPARCRARRAHWQRF